MAAEFIDILKEPELDIGQTGVRELFIKAAIPKNKRPPHYGVRRGKI